MQNSISIEGFDELLKLLDPDRDTAAGKYVRLRDRLERFFEWRNCENVEELTDIVFDRTVKKIADGERVRNLEAFCVSIAKYVFLESRNETFRTKEINESHSKDDGRDEESYELHESRLRCLDSCLAELPADSRSLIFTYFDTDEKTMIPSRKRLAESLGITLNTLRIKVCRLKSRLEKCTRQCCEG